MSLEGHVQAYADRVGRPVIVFDAEFHVVAFSVHDDETDQARLAIILAHRGSPVSRDLIRAARVGHSDGPVRIPPVDGHRARHVAPIRHDEYLVGYISYVPHDDNAPEPLTEDPELRGYRDAIGEILQSRALESREGVDRLLRLISGAVGPERSVRERAAGDLLSAGLLSSVDHYRVLSIDSSTGADPSGATLRMALDRLQSSALAAPSLTAAVTVRDAEGVAIVPGDVDRTRLEAMLELSSFSHLRVGIGGARPDPADLAASHREAAIARRGAEQVMIPGTVVGWDDLGIDRVLLQLPLETMPASDLPPMVQRLCDPRVAASLATTLETYLDCGCDAQQAAQVLHIHRSTLYYRLDRVRTLTGADLSDGATRRDLHTGLRLARLTGRL